LQAQIDDLEKRLAAVRREMELELSGADGRPAGMGPNYRRLSDQAQTIEGQLDEKRRELSALQGGATRQPPRPTGTTEPRRIFRDDLKDGGVGPEMVMLPGGSFLMGSPENEAERTRDEDPQHRVTVPPFALSRTEVSFADYDRFAEATGRKKPDDRAWGRGDRPVIYVSWNDAKAYAEWLSEQTGKGYRLPTEAEWEYATRAGAETPFWTGECIHTDQANYDGNYDYIGCGAKTGIYRQQTVRTGSLPANAFGLHEVAGNVYEWGEDCWHDSYRGAPTDGSAWLEGGGGDCAGRVLRGGGWYDEPWYLRSAARYWGPADAADGDVGLRLARTP